MAADLGLVVNAAKRETNELSARRIGDRFSKRCFADARSTDKAKDRSFRIFDKLSNGEKFENAFLDLFKTVMIFVQRLFGLVEIVDLVGTLLPRHVDQPVEIRARDGALGRHRRHSLETRKFLQGLFLGLFGHAGFFDLFLEVVELGLFVLAAEFLVNGLDLLVQIVLALMLVHLLFGARMDRCGRAGVFRSRLRERRSAFAAVPERRTSQAGPVFPRR